MKRWMPAILVLMATPAFAQDHDHDKKPEPKGEIRVYLADKDKKPVDLKGVTVTVLLEPKGGTRKVLKTELVTPKGDKRAGLGHGGEVKEMEGGYHVELVVAIPHGGHEEKGHDEKDEDATPYFKAEIALKVYECPMKCQPATDKTGKCAKCGMELKPVDLEFLATVIAKIKGETKNAKGFEHPPGVPGNYADAVAKMEAHLKEIRALIDKGDLEKVHPAAEKISRIAKKLAPMAPKDDVKEVEKLCNELVALFNEIDGAADGGNKPATEKAYAKYKERIEALKKHVKGGGHDHDK